MEQILKELQEILDNNNAPLCVETFYNYIKNIRGVNNKKISEIFGIEIGLVKRIRENNG